MLLRLRVTIAEHGFDADSAERLLEAFYERHPDARAVASQNAVDGTLSVTFSVEADDVFSGTEAGAVIFCESANACGLRVTDVMSAAAEAVEHPASTRELQPA